MRMMTVGDSDDNDNADAVALLKKKQSGVGLTGFLWKVGRPT